MTIPKIRQLPSGMWFCQLRLNGQSVSITDADRDTVEAKAYAYKAGVLKARRTPEDITVGTALTRYIDSRRNVVSPSTIRGYLMIQKHRFAGLQKIKLSALTAAIVQREVNAEATTCSPKTLKNAYGLIKSAISFAGGETFEPKKPQVPKHEKQYLRPSQIPIFCEAIRGNKYEAAALLALWSCRRSEILGLAWSAVDLEQRRIRLEQSSVIDEHEQLITKDTMKNNTSARTIPIAQQLYDVLSAVPEEDRHGAVIKGSVEGAYKAVNRVCSKNKLPLVGLHGLRHSFASLAHYLNMPLKTAMAIGGWADDHVMLSIYTHISEEEEILSAENEMLRFYDGDSGDESKDAANKNANDSDDDA